ncbi:S8 family peptidase [Sphingomonas sp. ZT3P38]|uniref:S8 family peptidase n=1 Tax=Parasphingomonas zepuensis TaxID=3096161 RepID=UPI002FCB52AE
MAIVTRQRLLRSAGLACLFAAAGCGGGGGGGIGNTPTPPVTPTPTPPATPTPTPAPTPTPTSADTAEYRATVGAVSANALAAYNRAATGAGITVGVIDSGIDLQSAEFGSRIDPDSASTAGNGTVDDEGGHGTAVSFTIAGRRNGAGTHGIAFDAALIVARADTPGSCADTSDDGGCSFEDGAIARGLDLARNNGARVVNISLGGEAANATLIEAINQATAAGIVIVISAGNDFEDHPDRAVNPDPFAQVANLAQARGLVIIAGSVGANDARTPGGDAISSFSNRAGNSVAHYLAAVGEHVRAPDEKDTPLLWSGTSFSAPQIAGAVALLAQAFPNLTGAQIVEILYMSARDAGAIGDDAVYGQGVLDLTAAFSPLGTSSVAGTHSVASLNVNATLSAPMGDARQGGLGAVILDGFSRAFAIDLARTIDRSGPSRTLGGVLESRQRSFSAGLDDDTVVALTIAPAQTGASVLRMTLHSGDAARARAIAGIVTKRLGSDAAFAIGFAEGSAALSARLAGRVEPAFLVARDPVQGQGFDSSITGSSAIRQQFGAIGLTAAIERGDVLTRDADRMPALQGRYLRYGYDRAAITIDRRFGGLQLGLTGTRLAERDTVLGARFGDALGGTRGTSWFLDGTARWEMGAGWRLGGSLRRGWTQAEVRGGLTGRGFIRTSAFAGDIGKAGVFGRFDSAGLRIAQPLRVASGGIDLRLPTFYDYDTLRVTEWTTQRLNLAPTGREIDLEARYALPFLGGAVQSNLFWRRDPGNFATLPDDIGGAVRYSVTF